MQAPSSKPSTLLIVVIVVAAMYLAGDVAMPLVLAGLLSFVLAIPVRALQRLRLSRPIAVLVVVVTTFAVIFALGQLVASSVSDLNKDLPKYEDAIRAKIDALAGGQWKGSGALEGAQGVLRELSHRIAESRPKKPGSGSTRSPDLSGRGSSTEEPAGLLGFPVSSLAALVSPLLGPLTSTLLSFVFVVFILIESEELRNRFIRLAGATDIPHTTTAMDDAARRLSRLFLTQFVINSVYGVIIGLGLWRIGVPGAFIWGALSGVLRFVPFVGPILGLIFPLILSIAVGVGWSMALWTIALYAGLEGVTGQFVEPLFEGRSTGLTPVAIVVAASFWAWIWGPVGLVMSTPLTVVLVVLGRHFEAFRIFDILLGDTPALSDSEALYQRLLAQNPIEAIAQAKAIAKARSLSEYCDEIVLPTLRLARNDAARDAIDEKAQAVFLESMTRLSSTIARRRWGVRRRAFARAAGPARSLPVIRPSKARSGPNRKVAVLVLGLRSRLDDAAASIFEALLKAHGLETGLDNFQALAAAVSLSGEPDYICVSSLDCHDMASLSDAVRIMRERAPTSKLILGLWGAEDISAVNEARAATGADFVFTRFHDAAYAILIDEAQRSNDGPGAEPGRHRRPEGSR